MKLEKFFQTRVGDGGGGGDDGDGDPEPVSVWKVFDAQRRRFANVLYDADDASPIAPNLALQAMAVCHYYLHAEDVSPEVAQLRAKLRALEASRDDDGDAWHETRTEAPPRS